MDSYLKELQGTLARTAQKKKTMLSRVDRAKREKHQNRFGARPANPQLCEELEAAKHFFNDVRQDANSKSRALIDAKFDELGEKTVRQMNEAANRGMREMIRWKRRVVALGGTFAKNAGVNETAEKAYASGQTVFIGAAKELPEALKKAQQIKERLAKEKAEKDHQGEENDTSDEDDEVDANYDLTHGAAGDVAEESEDPVQALLKKAPGGNKTHFLQSISPEYLEWKRSEEEERELRKMEARLELQLRKQKQKEAAAGVSDAESGAGGVVGVKRPAPDDGNHAAAIPADVLAKYIKKFEHVPTDEELKAKQLQDKKAALRARLAASKK